MKSVQTLLDEVGEILTQELAADLLRKKKDSSGKLIKSLKFKSYETPDGYEVSIYGEDYAKWVNIGRKKGGKKVPLNHLIRYIKIMGFETGNIRLKDIAFAMQMAIWQRGIKATNFIEDSIKITSNQVQSKVLEAMGFEVSNNIDNLIKKYWNSKDGTN